MKKLWILIGVFVAVLLLAPLVVPIFVPWSGINCQHQDINIKTGQASYSRSLWFVMISERIKDTPLSRALQGETVDVANINAWHRVNTFSPGIRHLPHYKFHSALYQARQMEMTTSMLELSPRAQERDCKDNTNSFASLRMRQWCRRVHKQAEGRRNLERLSTLYLIGNLLGPFTNFRFLLRFSRRWISIAAWNDWRDMLFQDSTIMRHLCSFCLTISSV